MANNDHRDQRRGDELPNAVRPGTDLRHRIRERVLARRQTFVAAALTGLAAAGCNETRDAGKTAPEPTTAVQPAPPASAKPAEPATAEPVDSSGAVPTGDLAEVCLSMAGVGAGSSLRIGGPLVAKVEGVTGNVSGVERSVNTALQDVGLCYVPAFGKSTSNALGTIDVVLSVGSKGEVLDVKHKAKGEVVRSVDCILERLRMITFSPPDGPRGRVKFKLLFSKRG